MTVLLEDYVQCFDARVAQLIPRLAETVPAFAKRLTREGVSAGDLTDVSSLSAISVLAKDDIILLQAQDPPFGGMLATSAQPRRIFQSPGPIYEPEADQSDAWRWAPALEAAGFRAGEKVVCAFGYHLSPAGAMFEEAARAIGCTVIPAGVGNVDLQAAACRDVGVTGFMGLPSYLKKLVEALEALGGRPFERAFLTAEPLPPSLRQWLGERVAVVRQGFGTAETGNLGYECEAEDGFHVPDDALVQVCDLVDGQPLPAGQEGQIVVTLFREDYSIVRFGTGDISAFLDEPCSCGRTTPRLAGWLGRVGEAVKVRGMFLHPRQVRAAMEGADGATAYRFVIDRIDHRDELRVEIQAGEGVDTNELVQSIRSRVRDSLRFNADVVVVDVLDADGPVLVDARSWD